jgi:propanol-preferring alcohol dehydrogenase
MKAMVLEKPALAEDSPLRLRELPRPEPKGSEILVRVCMCGVCRTDLHTIEAELELPTLPIIPGHQVVGVVESCGDEATNLTPGTRVGVAWLNETCGTCEYCLRGLENLCVNARFTGLHVNGGYAEYMTVKEAFAYPLPKGFSDRAAAPLLCAGIIGYRSLRLSGAKRAARVGMFGFGASAHVVIQVARHWECDVYVFSRTPSHQELAGQLGAVWAGSADQDPGVRLQAAIIFAPAGELIPRALELLDKGGTLALAGIYMTPVPPLDYEKHLYHEKIIRSVTAATRQDGRELLDIAARIPIHTQTTLYPLERANEALLDVKQSRVDGAAVLKVATGRPGT